MSYETASIAASEYPTEDVMKRMPEVQGEADQMGHAIEKLEKVTQMLTARLAIVTRPVDGAKPSDGPVPAPYCELGGTLRHRREDIERITVRLSELLDSLEV